MKIKCDVYVGVYGCEFIKRVSRISCINNDTKIMFSAPFYRWL